MVLRHVPPSCSAASRCDAVARTVAAFDFDGTLTRRDTLLPFLASVAGAPTLARALASDAARTRTRWRPGAPTATRRRNASWHACSRGRTHDDVLDGRRTQYGARLDARGDHRRDARTALAWHRREGHEIVIVSASLDVYLDAVARALDVDARPVHDARGRRRRHVHRPAARRRTAAAPRRRSACARTSATTTSSCGPTATAAATARCSRWPTTRCASPRPPRRPSIRSA